MSLFLSFVYVFSSQQTKRIRKTNRIERKKEDITLQNLAGGKYIYGPLNFIYARRKDVKCATTPSKWVIIHPNTFLSFYSTGHHHHHQTSFSGRVPEREIVVIYIHPLKTGLFRIMVATVFGWVLYNKLKSVGHLNSF